MHNTNRLDDRPPGERGPFSRRHPKKLALRAPFPRRVRSRLPPPAVSRQTIGSSAAEPHLPFVMSQHPCMPELRPTMRTTEASRRLAAAVPYRRENRGSAGLAAAPSHRHPEGRREPHYNQEPITAYLTFRVENYRYASRSANVHANARPRAGRWHWEPVRK